MAFTRANGIVLHYQVLGVQMARPLSSSIRSGSDFRIWQDVVPAFLDRFRVVLYDERGHGCRTRRLRPTRWTIMWMIFWRCSICSMSDRAAFVGLSVGGMIAQRIAVRAPERVQALVLCCTAAKIGTPEAWAERIAAVEQGGIESVVEGVLQRWFTSSVPPRPGRDCAGWRNMLVRTPAHGYAAPARRSAMRT